MRRAFGVALAVLSLTATPGAYAQLPPAGTVAIQSALDRLASRGSALLIAAHPDDENTALLAWLARGRNVQTAYLSLTRGEGGQNLIGSEQGPLLGLIRTQELMAARRIDGAEQMFTRAVDFGYSKTAEESLAKWGKTEVLADVVLAIRRFRPDVIILRFSGTSRDGHGQHQASAMLGKEAFEAAADPARFPEQLREVQPWRARRLVWNAFAFTPEQEKEAASAAGRIEVDLGAYSPLLGYSWSEIAAISRSQHRSQAMGSAERRGPQKNYFLHVAGNPASQDLFDGIELMAEVPEFRDAATRFQPRNPAAVIPLLLAGRSKVQDKRTVDEAIALCAGVYLHASAERPYAAWGSTVRIDVQAVNRSDSPLTLAEVDLGAGGKLTPNAQLGNNRPVNLRSEWQAQQIPPRMDRLAPEPEPALTATFRIRAGDQTLELRRPVLHRYVDRIRGELTRPFLPVPPVSLAITEPSFMFAAPKARKVSVLVRAHAPKQKGVVQLRVPAGWRATPSEALFDLNADGETAALPFDVTPPADSASGRATAVARVDGVEVSTTVLPIEHSHIPVQTAMLPAQAKLVRADVRVLARRVGYIVGAGDEVPDALAQMGCNLGLLTSADLTMGDLAEFDAIVTGVRAFNTRPDLRANHARLMQYVANGGTLVVQYNVLEGGFMGGDPTLLDRIGPLPMKIGRDRVSVEEAPVTLLSADHPLFRMPNQITAEDWNGWVQERGLYFPASWDRGYTALVSMSDPGEKRLDSGILFAKHGKGAFVFSSLSWFRQLPAGVPGAWRIFANLISAGKHP